jgi:DNA-binding NtrC family response regulator
MDLFSKLKEMKILLIDDDKWIRDSLSIFFEYEGCHLLAFETAEEAMKELEMHDYDIIIADYKLPGMDGLEFLKRIQDSHLDAMKILITAHMSEEIASEAKMMGIQDFIEKPFTIKTIEESLSRLIQRNEKQVQKSSSH